MSTSPKPPGRQVRVTLGGRPPPAGTLYAGLLAQLQRMELGLGVDASGRSRARGLAAKLTLAKYLLHAQKQFRQARNAANAALKAVNRLRNAGKGWHQADVDAAITSLTAVLADGLLTTARTEAEVRQGIHPSRVPAAVWAADLLDHLGRHGPPGEAQLAEFSGRFSAWASMVVGQGSSLFVEIDGVGIQILGGEREVRSDEAAQWLARELVEYLTECRGTSRGAARDADLIAGNCFSQLANGAQPPAAKLKYRALGRFFGRTKGRKPTGLPGAWHLGTGAALAEQLEQLSTASVLRMVH